MLLETLEEKRERNPLNVRRLLKKVARSPFWLQPAEPRRRPLIIDKLCLMELGLNEIQSEILLALWETGGRLPIWGNGVQDLCHELKTTSSILRRNIDELKELDLVKVRFKGKMETVIAKPPKEVFKSAREVLSARLEILSELFRLKQKEMDVKSRRCEEAALEGFSLSAKAKEEIEKLRKSEKIVCGFVVGRIENKGKSIAVENFFPIRTISGPKIHFNPIWKDYHKVKSELVENKKWIIGEFHTHINAELHEKDIEKMKMLSRGMWWILGEEIACYFFRRNNEKLNLTKIPSLIVSKRMKMNKR